jgi:phenylacetate-coenzyme A ligase PaaK-like adenylate-forming protein
MIESNIVKMQRELLKKTLKYVIDIPFYQNKYNKIDIQSITDIKDLEKLPLVTKEEVFNNLSKIVCKRPEIITFTSGTELKKPLYVFHNIDEIIDINKMIGKKIQKITNREKSTLGLHLSNVEHGQPLPFISETLLFSIRPYTEKHFKTAAKILFSKHEIPYTEEYVSRIFATPSNLKAFTFYLIEHGYDLSSSHITFIMTTGWYLTEKWRTILSKLWNAQVISRYSLTEIFGGATECKRCRKYHFDPFVIAEVVHPHTGKRIKSGIGVLVLTSLIPFQVVQPLIRYWTGDIVEINQSICKNIGYTFKGRVKHSILLKEGFAIYSSDVYNILENIPDVNLYNPYTSYIHFQNSSTFGYPKFLIEFNDETIILIIELRYHPLLFQQRIDLLREYIFSKLIENYILRKNLEKNTVNLKIKFLPPGDMSPFDIFKM